MRSCKEGLKECYCVTVANLSEHRDGQHAVRARSRVAPRVAPRHTAHARVGLPAAATSVHALIRRAALHYWGDDDQTNEDGEHGARGSGQRRVLHAVEQLAPASALAHERWAWQRQAVFTMCLCHLGRSTSTSNRPWCL